MTELLHCKYCKEVPTLSFEKATWGQYLASIKCKCGVYPAVEVSVSREEDLMGREKEDVEYMKEVCNRAQRNGS